MGGFSKVVFRRSRLPSRAIVCAGVYFPDRKNAFRRSFERWERLQGNWIRYSFARREEKDYVVIFGVYGAAMMLETVQLLREGGVRSIYMVGSMGARSLPVGTMVVPTSVKDKAGVVTVDDPNASGASPDRT